MDKNVCDDQEKFNKAFNKAVIALDKKPNMLTRLISALIVVVILVWALLLAMQVPADRRQVHLVLALVFAPFYIISHYLNMMQNK